MTGWFPHSLNLRAPRDRDPEILPGMKTSTLCKSLTNGNTAVISILQLREGGTEKGRELPKATQLLSPL